MSEAEARNWEKSWAGRKWLYIFRFAAVFCSIMIASKALDDWLWGDPIEFRSFHLIIYPVLGLMVGMAARWSGDSRYKSYLLDMKLKKGFRG